MKYLRMKEDTNADPPESFVTALQEKVLYKVGFSKPL